MGRSDVTQGGLCIAPNPILYTHHPIFVRGGGGGGGYITICVERVSKG